MPASSLVDFETLTRTKIENELRHAATKLQNMDESMSKGQLRQQLWRLGQMINEDRRFFSQAGQDHFLDQHVFKGKSHGVFLEIGAYDGISGSNTLHFEAFKEWAGILIEADPNLCRASRKNRNSPCLHMAIAPEPGSVKFLSVQSGYRQMGGIVSSLGTAQRSAIENDPRSKTEVISVPSRRHEDVLEEQGLFEIDYVSIDIEGAELGVLSTFPFQKYDITAWTIEANQDAQKIINLMRENKYRFLAVVGVDLIFAKI